MIKYFIIATLLFTVGAEAQVIDLDKGNWLKDIWKTIEPLWAAVIWPVLGVIAVMLVRKFLGDRAAQILQEMIQSAAKRAAGIALAENNAPLVGNLPSKELIDTGKRYMRETMNESLDKAKVTEAVLTKIVTANIGILMAPANKVSVK